MRLALQELPWRARVGAALLAAVLGVLVLRAAWIEPVRREVEHREQRLAQAQGEIAAARQVGRRRSELAAQVAALERRSGRPPAVAAGEWDAGALLRRLQTLASASNLAIRGFAPQATERREHHEERASRLELSGTFHDLARFFEHVGRLPWTVRVGDLELRAIEPPAAGASIAATCLVTTFHPEPIAPATARPAARPELSYDPRGRRDPFVGPQPAGDGVVDRPRGLAGVRIAELLLRGLVFAGGRYLGVLEAPGARTYVVRGAERLLDGAVRSVTHEAVVFEETGRDGSTGAAGREVRKVLASAQEER